MVIRLRWNVVLVGALLMSCDLEECTSGDEEPSQSVGLDEVVGSTLGVCEDADLWQINLEPGDYRIDAESQHESWYLAYFPERDEATASTCPNFGQGSECVEEPGLLERREKTTFLRVTRPGMGRIGVYSAIGCALVRFDCPNRAYPYTFVVRRCDDCSNVDAGMQ